MNPNKRIWNKSFFSWNVIQNLIEDNLALGDLSFFPKLTTQHFNPTLYEKMKVSIAAQTLSATVGLEIKRKGHKEFGSFILMMDRWFDMMNTSYYHSQRRGKPDMKPFETNDCFSNKSLIWLKNIFIPYFETLNKSAF